MIASVQTPVKTEDAFHAITRLLFAFGYSLDFWGFGYSLDFWGDVDGFSKNYKEFPYIGISGSVIDAWSKAQPNALDLNNIPRYIQPIEIGEDRVRVEAWSEGFTLNGKAFTWEEYDKIGKLRHK